MIDYLILFTGLPTLFITHFYLKFYYLLTFFYYFMINYKISFIILTDINADNITICFGFD